MSSTSIMKDHKSKKRKHKITWIGGLLHVGCYNSPLPTLDLVPRSKHEKARDTQNGDDLHAPTLSPSPSDVPTDPPRTWRSCCESCARKSQEHGLDALIRKGPHSAESRPSQRL